MNQSNALSKLQHLSDVKKALILSLALGAASVLSFKLPFMPVAWVVQSHMAIMFGYIFGARVGFLSAIFFLIEGALGAPVFSLGRSGLGMILGPSGGYLLAYPVAAFIAGTLKNKISQNSVSIFLSIMAANLVIYLLGAIQLSSFVGMKAAITLGIVPFMAMDVVKTCIATYLLKSKK